MVSVSCGAETTAQDQAMACDLCEKWEHVSCLRQCDKLSGELYAALMGCRSKALLYVCTSCRKKGSIVKRLNAYEVDCARAHEQLLASAQTIDQLREQVAELKSDKRALQAQRESLEGEMCELRARLANALPVTRTATTEPSVVPIEVPRSSSRTEAQPRESNHESEEHDSGGSSQRLQSSDSDSGSSQSSRVRQQRRRDSKDPHPPGFRTLLQRVDKFSGRQGDDDFEIWLVDFKEATEHCGWQDKQRAKWFSWFLSERQ